MAIVNNVIGIKTTYWADNTDGVQAVKISLILFLLFTIGLKQK